MVVDSLAILLAVSGSFMTLTGLAFWVQIMRPNRPPMDESNRIAHLRLVWFALKSPQRFVGLIRMQPNIAYAFREEDVAFPWLEHDEGDNFG